jgi:hypothetical protein
MELLTTLEVTGRKSGRTVSLPVVVAIVNGEQYLVSMLGEHVQWVHGISGLPGSSQTERNLTLYTASGGITGFPGCTAPFGGIIGSGGFVEFSGDITGFPGSVGSSSGITGSGTFVASSGGSTGF